MLIKKIGHKLFIKTKFYKILYLIAPILMLSSLISLYLIPQITQQYKFQQPILKTKVFTLQQIEQNSQQLSYQQIYPGINVALIYGRIKSQTILLVSKCSGMNGKQTERQEQKMFWNVYHNIKSDNQKGKKLLAKNVGFMCYNQSISLYKYMKYQAGDINYKPSSPSSKNLGIIRNALFINLQQTKSKSPTRIYHNIYSSQSQIHTDLDYYQAIKQLLQQVGLTKWQPCQYIDQYVLLRKIIRITNKYQWSFAFKHGICQFYQVMVKNKYRENNILNVENLLNKLNIESIQQRQLTINNYEYESDNNNYIFMQNGIQASTISILYKQQNQTEIINKISRLALSFLQQFVVLEDHLHSSSTIFLPLSQIKYIPLKALIIPGIIFLICTAVYLLIKVTYLLNFVKIDQQYNEEQKQNKQFLANTIQINTQNTNNKSQSIIFLIIITINLSFVQYLLNKTITYSLILSFIIRKLFFRYNLPPKQQQFIKILLTATYIFICEYFAIFVLSVCILAIINTLILCFLRRIVIFMLILIILGGAVYYGGLEIWDIIQWGSKISIFGQIVFYPLLIWVFIV